MKQQPKEECGTEEEADILVTPVGLLLMNGEMMFTATFQNALRFADPATMDFVLGELERACQKRPFRGPRSADIRRQPRPNPGPCAAVAVSSRASVQLKNFCGCPAKETGRSPNEASRHNLGHKSCEQRSFFFTPS